MGSQFNPDPRYVPFKPDEQNRLTDGIAEECHGSFYRATSLPHAEHIRQRLLNTQDDKAGQLGLAG